MCYHANILNQEGNRVMKKFNNILKSLRIREGLTQDDLAKKLGVSRSTISMYERGEREPELEVLEAIADFFNVDMNYLTGKQTQEEYYADLQIRQIAQEIFEDKDMRLLFDLKKSAKGEELMNYARYLKEQYERENRL